MNNGTWLKTFFYCFFSSLILSQVTLASDEKVTYSKDVAAIIFDKCVNCHNPDGIGPMSLLTFEETQPWAPLISYKVERREMPP